MITFSWGLFRKKLDCFVEASPHFWYFNPFKKPSTVVGWGLKRTSLQGRRYAKKHHLPFLSLEDGFLRSLSTPKMTPETLSLIVDDVGIYYDARQPSHLENILLDDSRFTPALLKRAKEGIDFLKTHTLSKYNDAPALTAQELGLDPSQSYVLVIDQTEGDVSIDAGCASASSFQDMLKAAIEENPGKVILIKTHPEVISGVKKGYLTGLSQSKECKIISTAVNPWSLFEYVESVYTVTSQLGFEALMAGKKVRCFGLPFYAGWGVTHDEVPCKRRSKKRLLTEIFAAAYLLYPRYINPFTSKLTTFEDVAQILAHWKEVNDKNKKIASFFTGKSPAWKARTIRQLLFSTDRDFKIFRTPKKTLNYAQKCHKKAAFWSAKTPNDFKKLSECMFVEDGFIRSVGLGANLVAPQSIVLDRQGIYYDPNSPSDLETILETRDFSTAEINRAEKLIQTIIHNGVSKYSCEKNHQKLDFSKNKKIILVVGQVEDDASIRLGTRDIKTNFSLLQAVRHKNPKAFIVYKTHPDVEAGHRKGHIDKEVLKGLADTTMPGVNTGSLLHHVDEVHTMTSLVGFEALLRHKKVFCYGIPFYAGWGLTHDRHHINRRTRKLTMQELVVGTLLCYPLYVDPKTGYWCSPEVLIDRLLSDPPKTPFWVRLRQIFGFIKRAF